MATGVTVLRVGRTSGEARPLRGLSRLGSPNVGGGVKKQMLSWPGGPADAEIDTRKRRIAGRGRYARRKPPSPLQILTQYGEQRPRSVLLPTLF